jgi:hypothetical protein
LTAPGEGKIGPLARGKLILEQSTLSAISLISPTISVDLEQALCEKAEVNQKRTWDERRRLFNQETR